MANSSTELSMQEAHGKDSSEDFTVYHHINKRNL
jgi:hypothetical protein